MLRCIAVIYASLHQISGYLLRDDATKQCNICNIEQTFMYVAHDRVINLTINNDNIVCKDCAISKLPKYTEGGFCLDTKAVYQIISRSDDGSTYLLLQGNRETRLDKRTVMSLLKSEDSTVCNAYIANNTLVLNSTDTLMSNKSSKSNRKSSFIIPDATITYPTTAMNIQYQAGYLAAYLLGKGFMLSDMNILLKNSETKAGFVHNYFDIKITNKHSKSVISFDGDVELDESEPTFRLTRTSDITDSTYNYLDIIDFDKDLEYLQPMNVHDPLEAFVSDVVYSADLDDDWLSKRLFDVLSDLQSGLASDKPISINNLLTVEKSRSLANSLYAAVSARDWSKISSVLYEIYHYRVAVSSFDLNLILELPLVQPARGTIYFNRGRFTKLENASQKVIDNMSFLNDHSVFDSWDLTKWCK